MSEPEKRAEEIANFLDIPYEAALKRLDHGFLHNHALVAEDFLTTNPQTDDELLAWYLSTEAYIWELSAYHVDSGFNYAGMTAGIVEKIRSTDTQAAVLVLGDGIGDTSLALTKAGIPTYYHDLQGSRTAQFAEMRHRTELGFFLPMWTVGWEPTFEWIKSSGGEGFGENVFQAVVALDFMEHLPEPQVAEWSEAVARCLQSGGHFAAQNAFAIGDREHGNSIPMHVSASNHYEYDWLPLMESLGLTQVGDIWWQKQ